MKNNEQSLLGRLNGSETAGNIIAPLGVVGGYLLASTLGSLVDKVSWFTPDPNAEGFQWKSFVKPVLLTTAGVGMVWIGSRKWKSDADGKQNNTKVLLKSVGAGFILAGVQSGTKALLKKEMSWGLGSVGNAGVNTTYYTEKKAEIDRLITENSWRPNPYSPDGEGAENPIGKPFATEMNVQNGAEIL